MLVYVVHSRILASVAMSAGLWTRCARSANVPVWEITKPVTRSAYKVRTTSPALMGPRSGDGCNGLEGGRLASVSFDICPVQVETFWLRQSLVRAGEHLGCETVPENRGEGLNRNETIVAVFWK